MRTYTLAGLVILLIVGCTPEGEGGDATQGDATQGDATSPRDVSADSADTIPATTADSVPDSAVDSTPDAVADAPLSCPVYVGDHEPCTEDPQCIQGFVCNVDHCAPIRCDTTEDCGVASRACVNGYCLWTECFGDLVPCSARCLPGTCGSDHFCH